MNERIKQLAKEAGYYLYDLTETHDSKTVETDSKDEWITLEKFAESIIQECASLVENEGRFLKYDRLAKKLRDTYGKPN